MDSRFTLVSYAGNIRPSLLNHHPASHQHMALPAWLCPGLPLDRAAVDAPTRHRTQRHPIRQDGNLKVTQGGKRTTIMQFSTGEWLIHCYKASMFLTCPTTQIKMHSSRITSDLVKLFWWNKTTTKDKHVSRMAANNVVLSLFFAQRYLCNCAWKFAVFLPACSPSICLQRCGPIPCGNPKP